MKKGITIDGCVTLKGTTANVLNIEAASKGISLTEYIRQALNVIANELEDHNQKCQDKKSTTYQCTTKQ